MFPDMSPDDLAKLAADIKANGLLDPIVVWRGEIVDGWHRYQACAKAGVEPRFVEFSGNDRNALAMVVSRNARRRHLSEAAVVGVTKRVLCWHESAAGHGGARGNQHLGGKVSGDTLTASDVASAGGVSVATVKRHSAIEQRSPALLAMAERGDIGLQTAERISQTASAEVLQAPTRAQIIALAHALSERPQARCAALLKAARDFRDEWRALAQLPQTPEVIESLHEAKFHIRQCRAPTTE